MKYKYLLLLLLMLPFVSMETDVYYQKERA